MTSMFIPSPSEGVWDLGPFPVRAYALCIIVGIAVAIWWGERRWVRRGGRPGAVQDIAMWACLGIFRCNAIPVEPRWRIGLCGHVEFHPAWTAKGKPKET